METQLEWAQLLIEKYDVKRAAERVDAALSKNPTTPRAGVVRAYRDASASDFVGAQAALTRALNCESALVLCVCAASRVCVARHGHRTRRKRTVARARDPPGGLEALSVKAAARFLDDDPRGFAEIERRVLEHNPHYGRFYSIVSEYAEWEIVIPRSSGCCGAG